MHDLQINMTFSSVFFSITLIHLLAAISPGPDFVIVSRNTLTCGRRAGKFCGLGICCGLSVHLTYSIAGLSGLIMASERLSRTITLLGGGYLLYLGMQGMTAARKGDSGQERQTETVSPKSDKSLWIEGFLCNLLNPKASLYCISIFSIVLSPQITMVYSIFLGLWIMIIQMVWYIVLVYILTIPLLNACFLRAHFYIDKILSAVLVAMGFIFLFKYF